MNGLFSSRVLMRRVLRRRVWRVQSSASALIDVVQCLLIELLIASLQLCLQHLRVLVRQVVVDLLQHVEGLIRRLLWLHRLHRLRRLQGLIHLWLVHDGHGSARERKLRWRLLYLRHCSQLWLCLSTVELGTVLLVRQRKELRLRARLLLMLRKVRGEVVWNIGLLLQGLLLLLLRR